METMIELVPMAKNIEDSGKREILSCVITQQNVKGNGQEWKENPDQY